MKENDEFSPVIVYSGTQWEAAFMKSLLEDNEIDAFLKDEIFGTMMPFITSPGGGPVKVIVPKNDEERARQIVAEYLQNRTKKGEESTDDL